MKPLKIHLHQTAPASKSFLPPAPGCSRCRSFGAALGAFATALGRLRSLGLLRLSRRRLGLLPGLQAAVQAPAAERHGLLGPLQTHRLGDVTGPWEDMIRWLRV